MTRSKIQSTNSLPAQATRRHFKMKIAALAALFGLLSPLSPGAAAQDDSDSSPKRTGTESRTTAPTGQRGQQDQPMVNEKSITRAVQTKLELAEGLDTQMIDVQTGDSTVTLSGTVNSLLAKERAANISLATRGVTGVKNNISVKPIARSDQEIQKDIETALALDPATESYEINAAAKSGVVTLSGTVQSWQEQQLALRAVKSVRGVKEVKDEIQVKYVKNRPDTEIAHDIQGRFRADAQVDEDTVKVQVEDGTATLSGTVESGVARTWAIADAWVLGVKDVEAEQLTVQSKRDTNREANTRADKSGNRRNDAQGGVAKQTESGTSAKRNDAEIRNDIVNAFIYHPRIASTKPELEVVNGVVSLSGKVGSLQAKRAAEAEARKVEGVRRVKNYLKVRPDDQPTDAKLAKRVDDALLRDVTVSGYEVQVTASNGKVTLAGEVDSSFEKMAADNVASRISGVVDVQNNLKVGPDFSVTSYSVPILYSYYPYSYYPYNYFFAKTDWEIREDIQDQMFWSPFVNDEEVNVTVDDGVATLTGSVDDYEERRDAGENARDGGATSVVNNLKVYDDYDYGLFEN